MKTINQYSLSDETQKGGFNIKAIEFESKKYIHRIGIFLGMNKTWSAHVINRNPYNDIFQIRISIFAYSNKIKE